RKQCACHESTATVSRITQPNAVKDSRLPDHPDGTSQIICASPDSRVWYASVMLCVVLLDPSVRPVAVNVNENTPLSSSSSTVPSVFPSPMVVHVHVLQDAPGSLGALPAGKAVVR